MWVKCRDNEYGYINICTNARFTVSAVATDFKITFEGWEIARFDTEQSAKQALDTFLATQGVITIEGDI